MKSIAVVISAIVFFKYCCVCFVKEPGHNCKPMDRYSDQLFLLVLGKYGVNKLVDNSN